jgi:hypothetical protein
MNNLLTVSPNIGSTAAALRQDPAAVLRRAGHGGGRPVPVPAEAHRPRAAEHVDRDAADHRRHLAGDEAGGVRRHEAEPAKQFEIFRDKHTWSMTLLYIVTFGSFIGFSNALPLSINVIFGQSHVLGPDGVLKHMPNPNAPSALTYAWIGPFVGALIRPVGGWISDKVGGSIVTQVISVVMVGASAAVGYVMMLAYGSATPEQYFLPFMACSSCCSPPAASATARPSAPSA